MAVVDRSKWPIEFEVVDVHRQIVIQVDRSAMYRGHLHPVRTGNGWQIVNALYGRT